MEETRSHWLARSVIWKSKQPLAAAFRKRRSNGGNPQPLAGEISRLEIKAATGCRFPMRKGSLAEILNLWLQDECDSSSLFI